ncbi:MAG: M48 family metallopeptidase [Cytophagaceae bacterium]|jgi:predicted Zn-dependent protease|nr:M48 family metallopeptidase [Cytophagaceae bacterium]
MKIVGLKQLLILAGVVVSLWLVFYFVSAQFPKENSVELISIEQEEKLGRLLVDDVLLKDPKTKILNNETLDSAMRIIQKRLLNNIGPTEYQYSIRVLESSEINAFTMPGGNIFVFSGLINQTESPEELAAVLAHEIGHAEKRHVVGRLVKELGITILFSVVTGGDAVLLPEISRTITSTVFDRQQEKEADDFALDLLSKSNINPKAMASFFRKIDAITGKMDNLSELIATHPNNNSRIKNALEYKPAKEFKEIAFDLNWARVKETISAENTMVTKEE